MIAQLKIPEVIYYLRYGRFIDAAEKASMVEPMPTVAIIDAMGTLFGNTPPSGALASMVQFLTTAMTSHTLPIPHSNMKELLRSCRFVDAYKLMSGMALPAPLVGLVPFLYSLSKVFGNSASPTGAIGVLVDAVLDQLGVNDV